MSTAYVSLELSALHVMTHVPTLAEAGVKGGASTSLRHLPSRFHAVFSRATGPCEEFDLEYKIKGASRVVYVDVQADCRVAIKVTDTAYQVNDNAKENDVRSFPLMSPQIPFFLTCRLSDIT